MGHRLKPFQSSFVQTPLRKQDVSQQIVGMTIVFKNSVQSASNLPNWEHKFLHHALLYHGSDALCCTIPARAICNLRPKRSLASQTSCWPKVNREELTKSLGGEQQTTGYGPLEPAYDEMVL